MAASMDEDSCNNVVMRVASVPVYCQHDMTDSLTRTHSHGELDEDGSSPLFVDWLPNKRHCSVSNGERQLTVRPKGDREEQGWEDRSVASELQRPPPGHLWPQPPTNAFVQGAVSLEMLTAPLGCSEVICSLDPNVSDAQQRLGFERSYIKNPETGQLLHKADALVNFLQVSSSD